MLFKNLHFFRSFSQYQRFQSKGTLPQPQKLFWSSLAVLGGLMGIYYVTHLERVPITGRLRFIAVSEKKEQEISQAQYQGLLRQFQSRLLPSGHPQTQMIRRIAQRLISVCGIHHWNWDVHVIASNEANAFVIPGGKIFVFTGLLPVAGDEDGIAAVLGHEIAHQVARHMAENISKIYVLNVINLVVSWVFDIRGIFNQLLLHYGFMVSKNYSLGRCLFLGKEK